MWPSLPVGHEKLAARADEASATSVAAEVVRILEGKRMWWFGGNEGGERRVGQPREEN